MKPPLPPTFTVSPDGETVTITTDCSPVSQPHTATVTPEVLRDAWLACERARYGVDVWGNL